MTEGLTVLKLGGALITDKSKPYSLRCKVLRSAADEIKECLEEGLFQSLVIIQGVGSYGHPPVLENQLHKGYQGDHQLLPLSWTQAKVNELRAIVMQTLYDVGIPIILLHPSSFIIADKMKPVSHFLEPLERFLSVGFVPLIGGDILMDRTMKFSIGSGDTIASLIARNLGAKRVIFATDVAGIYESDPKQNPEAKMFKSLDLGDLDEIFAHMGEVGLEDASGAMRGKIASLEPLKDLIQEGMNVSIISMMEYGKLKSLLHGDTSNSTQIVVS